MNTIVPGDGNSDFKCQSKPYTRRLRFRRRRVHLQLDSNPSQSISQFDRCSPKKGGKSILPPSVIFSFYHQSIKGCVANFSNTSEFIPCSKLSSNSNFDLFADPPMRSWTFSTRLSRLTSNPSEAWPSGSTTWPSSTLITSPPWSRSTSSTPRTPPLSRAMQSRQVNLSPVYSFEDLELVYTF